MTDAPDWNTPATPAPAAALAEAPGARTARICGIAAIACALTCVAIPLAIILGILALVKANKARTLARQYPETYGLPTSGGLILGIVGLALPVVMLPFAGIVSAIAIPALLSQRNQARDKAMEIQWAQVRSRAEAIALEAGATGAPRLSAEGAINLLLSDASLKAMKNVHNPADAVLIRGTQPRPGTIALSPARESGSGGTTTESVVLRAFFGPANSPITRDEKVDLWTVAPGSSFTEGVNR